MIFAATHGTDPLCTWRADAAIYPSMKLVADDGDLTSDNDIFKEFVVSQDDLVPESAQEQPMVVQQCNSEQHRSQPSDPKPGDTSLCNQMPLQSECSNSNSMHTEPPLSPSIDGSDDDASPESSVTFAGKHVLFTRCQSRGHCVHSVLVGSGAI